MTNKQAIEIIRKEYLCVDRDCDIERSCGKCPYMMPSKEPILEAYKMAIKALSQEPCDDAISRPAVIKFEGTNMACMGGDEIMKEFENNTQQNNDKAISLERAKKQIGRWIGYIDQDMINRICMSLDALPSVTQKSKTGHWIVDEYGIRHCPFCNAINNTVYDSYCPNCGARMVEPQESEDKE